MIGAWFRLGFVAASSGFVLGLVELARWQSWPIALVVGVVGALVAAGLAEDWQQPPAQRGRVRHRPWRRTGPYESDS